MKFRVYLKREFFSHPGALNFCAYLKKPPGSVIPGLTRNPVCFLISAFGNNDSGAFIYVAMYNPQRVT